MAHQLTGIDHVVLRVPDPEAARETYRRMGFTPTAVSDAAESEDVSDVLMFPRSHIALAPGDIGAGEIGLSSLDIVASMRSLGAAGFRIPPASRYGRSVEGGGGHAGYFGLKAPLPDDSLPGISAVLCQKDAAPAEWPRHPNGATGIVSLTVVVDDPEALIPRYNRLFGPAASTPTDDIVTVHTGRGLIYLVHAERFDDLHPSLDLALPGRPSILVLTVAVEDLGRTAALLAAAGVHAALRGDHLGVRLADELNFGVEFVEA